MFTHHFKMKSIFSYLLVALIVLLSSCVKNNNPDPVNPPDPTDPTSGIPATFDWKTIKELKLTISVNQVQGYSADAIHVIRVYNSLAFDGSTLLATGAARPSSPYNLNVAVASPIPHIYVQETRPDGLVRVRKVEILSTNLNVNLEAEPGEVPMLFKANALAGPSFPSPSIPIPTQYDVVVNNNNSLTTTGFAAGETSAHGNTYKSYLIPAGFTRTSAISTSHGSAHAILYVQGTLNVGSKIDLNRTSIVVLPGGQIITSDGINTGSFAVNIPIIYVDNGGTITMNKPFNLTNGIDVVNKGLITINGGNNTGLDLNGASTIYNEGTITLTANKGDFKITNSSKVYNSGIINSDELSMSVATLMHNDHGAAINLKKWYMSNTAVLDNYGVVTAQTEFGSSGGGFVNNYCRIVAGLTSIQSMTAVLESGSLWISDRFYANNSSIEMIGGSMFVIGSSEGNIFKLTVTGPSQSFAVFYNYGSMTDLRWAQTSFTGSVEYVQETLVDGTGTNGRGLYESSFSGGALLVKEQTKNIPASGCNLSMGVISNGGGNPNPGPDPVFASFFPSESGWGTYAFEDLYPHTGDYDMNDIVISFRASFFSNPSNLITELHLDYKIEAIGATQIIAAAFQLDMVPASNILSVTGQELGGGEIFSVSANGTEVGVTEAVVPLFNNAKHLEDTRGQTFLNTMKGRTHYATSLRKIVVKFATPVSPNSLNMSNFNFFISTVERGREIHLPTFRATSKYDSKFFTANLMPSDRFKNKEGMMFGLMFPERFNYPAEGKDIREAYLFFVDWARSSGNLHSDWFMDREGYRNAELIY